jgi:serine/threonine protein phosphatase PrpC
VGASANESGNPYRNEFIELKKCDMLFLYSDGLTTMTNKDPQRDALNELLLALKTSDHPEKNLNAAVNKVYPSGKTDDDILVIGFEV